MRRIGAHGALGSEREAGIGASLGAVSVYHVGLGLRGAAHDMGEHEKIAGIGVAAHRNAGEAEREPRLERSHRVIGARKTCRIFNGIMLFRVPMILSENRFSLFGIMR